MGEAFMGDRTGQPTTAGWPGHVADWPLIYVNEGFERMTGCPVAEVLGRNCRFLQGPDSDAGAIAEIRAALREHRECVVELLNYRKDDVSLLAVERR